MQAAAKEITGMAAVDFSPIRKAKLDRFTIDRIMGKLELFDQEIDSKKRWGSRRVASGGGVPN